MTKETKKNNTIKILYICHDAGLYGSQKSLFQIISELSSNDRYQVFLTIAREGPFLDQIKQLNNVTALRHRRIQWVKHDKRTIFQFVNDLVALVINILLRSQEIIGMIKKYDIDLVHTNSLVSLEGAIAAKVTNKPHLWHIRELFMLENPKIQLSLGKSLTRTIIQSLSSRVLCISRAVQSQFLSAITSAPYKFPVLYNVVQPAENNVDINRVLPEKKKSFRLGYVGRLSSGKRLMDLLEALELLPKGLDIECLVAGEFVDDIYRNQVDSLMLVRESDIPVTFLGHCSPLNSLYETLDVLVVPSLNEPFGRVIIEAAFEGVPVIGADSGGIPEIITAGETGWLFPAKDIQALAKSIEHSVKNKNESKAIGEKARRMVKERFTIEHQIRDLLAIYEDVLEED